jgi:predicted RNase H-like nuclease (RuvC/YqgF family)
MHGINISIIVVAIGVGIRFTALFIKDYILPIWQAKEARRQADASEEQAEQAKRQTVLSEQEAALSRYRASVEALQANIDALETHKVEMEQDVARLKILVSEKDKQLLSLLIKNKKYAEVIMCLGEALIRAGQPLPEKVVPVFIELEIPLT